MNILVCLSDPKHNRWYSTSENFLDLNLDTIITSQTKVDDYKIQVIGSEEKSFEVDEYKTQTFYTEEKLFETYITKECYIKLKNELDTE